MHTISFFSFKGGVGRTNLLLNVAYGLARDGHFVVIADWDLHAPGLTTIEQLFPPKLESSDGNVERPWNVRQGVLDYLDAALDPEAVLPDPATLVHATRLGSNARCEQTGEKRIEGDIWFIPAGRFDPRDPSQHYHNTLLRVQGRNLAGWLARTRSVKNEDPDQSPIAVATYFRDRVASIEHDALKNVRKPDKPRTPDYLLLDSRTGMTEIGDLVLGAGLAERMVLVTGLNEQNLAGLESVIRDLQNHIRIGELPTHVIIVASPVPEGEEILKKKRLDRLHDRIGSLARPTNSDLREELMKEPKKETMPRVFEIPYHPFIALQETPILAEIPKSGPAQAIDEILDQVRELSLGIVLASQAGETRAARLIDATKGDRGTRQARRQHRLAKIEKHPWSDVPVWNWPDPEWTIARFLPQGADPLIDIMNDLARSIYLPKDELLGILNNLGGMYHSELDRLEHKLKDEQKRLSQVRKEDWEPLLWTAASYLLFWADIWCERTGAQQEEALRALAAGERDQALGVWPSIGYFWFALAERLVDRSQWEAAERAYERATQLDPDYPPAWERLGNLRRRFLNNYKAAETAYKEALKLDEHDAEARSGLGDVLAQLDDHEGAVRELIRATKDDSENAKVWNMLGYFYGDIAGNQDKADNAYRKAMELDSRLALTRQNYAEGGLLIRDFSRAEEYLNKAEPLLMNDTDRRHQGILQLALSLARSDPEGAKAAHERLTAINERLKKPSIWWNFKPLRQFSEGLDRPSRELLDAWIDAVEHKPGKNPATAFADYMKRVEPSAP